jgi:XTP/dITP diphosphohydrolase
VTLLRLPRLVVATGNVGKLREFAAMLEGVVGELIPQKQLGVTSIAETETTFTGNALLKARHAARVTGLPALADDSGLEVDVLDGAPGVWSARYAGIEADDAQNNAKLLRELAEVPAPRRARYRAVLALVRAAEDPEPLIAEGVWEGAIALSPRGECGFGYDPLFLVDDGVHTSAELTVDEKNKRSHRAKALRQLMKLLRDSET